jgi:hypothetical protein
MRYFFLLILLSLTAVVHAAEDPLANLRKGHPRLMVTGADAWDILRERAKGDAELAGMIGYFNAQAQAVKKAPTLTRKQTGRRLLDVSRESLRRITLLSFSYRMTGDGTLLERAILELEAVCAFDDWNPDHFLDVAEMTAGLAIGYDWLYDKLPETTRTVVRQAIVEKALRHGNSEKEHWWLTRDNNWNQVCIGGLVMGALAIADEEPKAAVAFLRRGRENVHHGLDAYAPDGIYPEGPGYWSYGTQYSVMMIAALQTALGTDWGITESPGFMASAGVYVQTCTPTGGMYNFSDGSSGAAFRPCLAWFARELKQPGLLFQQRELLAKDRGRALRSRIAPLTALWWPQSSAPVPDLPLHWSGNGINPLVIMRESWADINALCLAAKGGTAYANHAHMDAGSFVLEADGVRWGIEVQQQGYHKLESQGVSLWGRDQKAQRWRIFRLGPFVHNTLTIDGRLHVAKGRAAITAFSAESANPFARLDLGPVFEGQAESVMRGFQWRSGREVLVQDELSGLKPDSVVRWAMATRAAVSVEGASAVLRQSEKTLHAEVSGQERLAFDVISADPPRGDRFSAPNPGVQLLIVRAPAGADGQVRMRVRFRAEKKPAREAKWVTMAEWK